MIKSTCGATFFMNVKMNNTVDYLIYGLETGRNYINSQCMELEAWQIILYSAITVSLVIWIHGILFNTSSAKSFQTRVIESFFYHIKKIPFVRKKIEEQMETALEGVSAMKLYKLKKGMVYKQSLPYGGMSQLDVLYEADQYLSLNSVNWKEGTCSGAIYSGDDSLKNLVSKIYSKFVWSNPLHPDIFPAIRKMEAEVIRMTCQMFNGNPVESCGSVSSGGTESILLACKAYRTWAYEKGITRPEIVCPVTVHAAFEKAADYFQMKLVSVPLDPVTWEVDMRAMRRAINGNTCMLVGSAPNFPHGIIDPIEQISKLGLQYNIPVHVDSCLGGFLIPFMEEAGFKLPMFDFRLKGVTSISADTHKYGYTPKGTSCILYSSKKWIHYQYFISPDWPGGIYATPTFSGSRAGALVAVCWATMMHLGRVGYVDCTTKVISTTRYIINALRDMEYIYVIGDPLVSVISIASLDFDIYRLSDKLLHKGWNLNNLQFPSCFHLCCTMLHTHPGVADRFINDVKVSVDEIMVDPKAKATGGAAIYGMAQAIPDRSLISDIASTYLDSYYNASNAGLTNGSHANGGTL